MVGSPETHLQNEPQLLPRSICRVPLEESSTPDTERMSGFRGPARDRHREGQGHAGHQTPASTQPQFP